MSNSTMSDLAFGYPCAGSLNAARAENAAITGERIPTLIGDRPFIVPYRLLAIGYRLSAISSGDH